MDQSTKITTSWHANADNWIASIDNAEIESRILATNDAIVNTICSHNIQSIIDIGCGEGWLTRCLQNKGITAFGVDAVSALIENAIEKGGEHYAVASFNDLATGKYTIGNQPGAAVINFALLDKTDSDALLKNINKLIVPGGLVFIQTLHPSAIAQQEPYVSGWKEGSWKGLKRDFQQPYEWYFRTLGEWASLFSEAGLTIRNIEEPLHPQSQSPVSIIFVLKT
ncbi:2-polyprenyl-3-methyl-5-hydroxy-6-metoxy-1,4-benzoquinol methylase [Chitinophaga sp. W2I13]|uniref:class I SAM-dependent methyltransferase n=1 Tax=Chitinophaga sp. W2I13 TaxID=3373923 RepID=UPI003D26155F